jgi:general secretion pathway protein N
MRPRGWPLVAGLGAYIAALIVMMPASLADAALRIASTERLRIADAQGTLWSGTGRLEFRGASGQGAIGQPVAWRFVPLELLRARLGYSVLLGAGTPPFSAALTWSRLELAHVLVSLPAAAAGVGAPALGAFALSGQLQVRIPSLSVGRGHADGTVELRWQAAGSGLSPVSPLGDYEMRLVADGAAIRATLRTLQGPLSLEGRGAWPMGAPPAFLATAHMPADLHPPLAPFLRLVAMERADRSFEFRLK